MNGEELDPHYDPVNHPAHYTQGKFEVIEVIEDWKLDFCLANAVKYIGRAEHKYNAIEDLKKAVWYINRRIQQLTEAQGQPDLPSVEEQKELNDRINLNAKRLIEQ